MPFHSTLPPFSALFGRAPEVTATAPGRVNLMGEHTDYNGGLVLPTAIPQSCEVALARRVDGRVRVVSALVAAAPREYQLGEERREGDWLDYVAGCTAALLADGHSLTGFDARIASSVPVGAGVSSSAALAVSVLRALRAVFALALDDVALARLAHRAEHDFVGARVGIMDQLAASLADERSALFLDTRSLDYERVALPPSVDLVVLDSGVAHRHATGGYNARRAECERACALLGVTSLRDLEASAPLDALLEPLGRRVRHVLSENARVVAAVAALRAGDVAALGRLFSASHASQRDDYEVSCPEIDALVGVASADPRVAGARLTGGGFGGAVVLVAEAGTAAAVAVRAATAYAERTGLRATRLVPPPEPALTPA
ncbi:MAG TPA: galactokinase [Candidatus Binatia bacterium]|jgi:galactokinase